MPDTFYVLCAASGMAVPVNAEEKPDKTLAPASMVAIGHLRENPDVDWAKAARIKIPPGEQYVWLVITEENQHKFDGGEYDFNHGAVFVTKQAQAKQEGQVVEIEGQIDEQIYEGSSEARVDRETLEDEEVQSLISTLKNQSTNHERQRVPDPEGQQAKESGT